MGVVGFDGAQDGFGGGVGRPEGGVVEGEVGEEDAEEEGSRGDDHEGAELVATHFGGVSRLVSSRLVWRVESADGEVREYSGGDAVGQVEVIAKLRNKSSNPIITRYSKPKRCDVAFAQ